MEHARQNGWLILTRREKPTVIQIRSEDVSPEGAAPAVIAAIRMMRAELEQGTLITVDPHRTRLRYLPLQK